MNIEKQRTSFENYELKKKPSANPKILFQRFEIEDLGSDERKYTGQYISHDMQEKWELWLAAQQQKGYVLVPVEPTEKMLDASRRRQWDDLSSPYEDMDRLKYKAMIKAAQE